MADARYLASSKNLDPIRARLFSAVACELKIKDELMKGATDETRPFVDHPLNSLATFRHKLIILISTIISIT
jgi:hypothetical protein